MVFCGAIDMKPMLVQIYEVQSPWEAEQLVSIGVDHIGSVLLSENRDPQLWDTIRVVADMGATSSMIPLFSGADALLRAIDRYRPDVIHFCEVLDAEGRSPAGGRDLVELQGDIRRQCPQVKIMRTIPIAPDGHPGRHASLRLGRMFEPVSDFLLTDTILAAPSDPSAEQQPVAGFVGITGRICNWDIAAELVAAVQCPVILAGGLSPLNVFDGILRVGPAGVDSCTGTNATDHRGRPIRFKKDLQKIRQLVREVRRAEGILSRQLDPLTP